MEELAKKIEDLWQSFRRHKHRGQALDQTEVISPGSSGSGSVDLTTDVTGALPIANGGTGAVNAEDARTNLGITDATLPFSDITTNNTSTVNHGFTPKLSGTATHYLDGLGNWSTPPSATTPTLFNGVVKVLCVGAGGGGAGNFGFGGGGGGSDYDAAHAVIAHLGIDQAYPVVVGVGNTSDGGDSTFHTLTGFGGKSGNNGGTGGVTGGGNGGSGNGAGAGGNGVNGTANSITGASVTYGGGGGGAGTTTNGTGGLDFGRAGQAGDGLAGGGGGGSNGGPSGSTGGTGKVIISYVTADFGPCTGGTLTVDGVNTVHTFTSSGTFIVVAI